MDYVVTADDDSGSVSVNCTPAAGSTFPLGTTQVDCTAADASGNAASCSFIVSVVNHAPEITALSGPTVPLASGSSASITVQFTDFNSDQPHLCHFAWDDGSSDSVSVAAGIGSATQTHTYTAAGVYSVTVTVSDACVSVTQTSEFVVVYDPNGGFVTGGGWIDSPAGACPTNPTLSGKATFGFISKYKAGASTPTGETEFQFKAGDLNFRSSSYQWLVVAGPKAQYKGTGTLNGLGNYTFILTATDGQVTGGGGVDKFRIKITDDETVVYDNMMGAFDDIDTADSQVVAGGAIVVHK